MLKDPNAKYFYSSFSFKKRKENCTVFLEKKADHFSKKIIIIMGLSTCLLKYISGPQPGRARAGRQGGDPDGAQHQVHVLRRRRHRRRRRRRSDTGGGGGGRRRGRGGGFKGQRKVLRAGQEAPHQDHGAAGEVSGEKKQEQTKFYDLRRGITEDFQRLAKFQRTLSKSAKKIHRF